MRVRMLSRAAGPHWSASAGDEVDLPLKEAAGLVSGGYAIALDPPVVETAAIDPAREKAVQKKPQPRRK